MQKLKVWCLSDGRPGHFNQSKGMIKALEHGFEIELEWIEIKLKLPLLRKLMRFLLNRDAAKYASCIDWMYQYRTIAGLPKPDLILSTGGNTSYLNIALAKQLQCKSFFTGSLRGLKASLFSRVFTIEPVGAENNIVMSLAPTPVSWDELLKAGKDLRSQNDVPLWTMLIGGATKEYRFNATDWESLADGMNQLANKHGIKWLVTTSRRTGGEVEKLLSARLDQAVIADAVWYGERPRKVMASFLGAAEQVFCTEDSLSMLTEAVSAGKMTLSVQPAVFDAHVRYENALERLQSRGWIDRVAASQLQTTGSLSTNSPLEEPSLMLWRQINESLSLKAKDIT